MTDSAIVTVDLAALESEDPSIAESAAADVRRGFGGVGAVHVTNHGVDLTLLARLYAAFAELTARPESEKRRLCRPELWFQRGWTPPRTERAVGSVMHADQKEGYFVAPVPSDTEMKLQFPQLHADNVWPEPDPGLRAPSLELGRQLQRAGQRLLRGAEHALRLPRGELTSRVEGGPHVFRMLHLLPLCEADLAKRAVWEEEHTDFNLLTLLPGDEFRDWSGAPSASADPEAGAYFRTRPTAERPSGTRVRGAPPPGCLVAQVGQAFEILTGGAFLATPRAIAAPVTPGLGCLSAAHFVHLHSHQMLFPLTAYRTERAIREYSPPVLAGTYALKTLVDIGLAPPEALGQLGYRHYDRLAAQRLDEKRSRAPR
jgi:isopenicillin N synthase-like dioxygenase